MEEIRGGAKIGFRWFYWPNTRLSVRPATVHRGTDDGGVDGGKTDAYTVDVPGRYEYFCIPSDAHMTGMIVVEDD